MPNPKSYLVCYYFHLECNYISKRSKARILSLTIQPSVEVTMRYTVFDRNFPSQSKVRRKNNQTIYQRGEVTHDLPPNRTFVILFHQAGSKVWHQHRHSFTMLPGYQRIPGRLSPGSLYSYPTFTHQSLRLDKRLLYPPQNGSTR